MIKEAIAKVVKGEDLDDVMMTKVMDEIMEGEATDAQKASFLTAMSMKGETIEEITSAAKVMRSHCEKFLNNMDVLEIVVPIPLTFPHSHPSWYLLPESKWQNTETVPHPASAELQTVWRHWA